MSIRNQYCSFANKGEIKGDEENEYHMNDGINDPNNCKHGISMIHEKLGKISGEFEKVWEREKDIM